MQKQRFVKRKNCAASPMLISYNVVMVALLFAAIILPASVFSY